MNFVYDFFLNVHSCMNCRMIGLLGAYARFLTLPLAMIVGYVGTNIESWVSNKDTSARPSIVEKRLERLHQEQGGVKENLTNSPLSIS